MFHVAWSPFISFGSAGGTSCRYLVQRISHGLDSLHVGIMEGDREWHREPSRDRSRLDQRSGSIRGGHTAGGFSDWCLSFKDESDVGTVYEALLPAGSDEEFNASRYWASTGTDAGFSTCRCSRDRVVKGCKENSRCSVRPIRVFLGHFRRSISRFQRKKCAIRELFAGGPKGAAYHPNGSGA